jgi:predicted nucleotidyltransferase
MARTLFSDPEALARLCRQNRIRRLSLFGSTLKGLAGEDSDVDLLVEFEPGAKPGLLGLSQIELELSGLLGGRKVDLRTAEDINSRFRDEVVGMARSRSTRPRGSRPLRIAASTWTALGKSSRARR